MLEKPALALDARLLDIVAQDYPRFGGAELARRRESWPMPGSII